MAKEQLKTNSKSIFRLWISMLDVAIKMYCSVSQRTVRFNLKAHMRKTITQLFM